MDQSRGNSMFALPVAHYEAIPRLAPILAEISDDIRREALEAFMPALQERYRLDGKAPARDYEARIGRGDDILRALQDEGVVLRSFGEATRRQIRDHVRPMALQIAERLDGLRKLRFSDSQIVLDPAEHARLYLTVENALTECGAIDAFSAYARGRLGLFRLVVQVNTARETKMRYGELDAKGLPEHRTSYWHVDSKDWPTVKALIYASDVELDQGPFRFVRGSHRMMGDFEARVRKTNDKLRQKALHFLALPPEFGQHANFGEYVDEHTPGVAELLSREVALFDGRSDLVLFDNNGVHRGGFVRTGHRVMLQCQFWRAEKIVSTGVGVAAARAALQTA